MAFGSFEEMAQRNQAVAFWCACPGWHGGGLTLTAAQAVERWGPAENVENIRRRLRCKWCGHRGKRIIADVWTQGRRRSF